MKEILKITMISLLIQIDMSCNNFNDENPKNNPNIFVIFFISYFGILYIGINEEHL